MMMALGYIISFILGYLLLRVLWPRASLSPSLFFILSLGLGLGCSALLTFGTFLASGGFHRDLILAGHGVVFIFLFFACRSSDEEIHLSPLKNFFPSVRTSDVVWNSLFWIAILFSFKIIFDLAQSHPFGQWDAWAVWNMKTKFLVEAGPAWQNIFQLHWHTQPDYPLLLPFLNTWIYAASEAPLNTIALTTSVVFTILPAVLIFSALKAFAHPGVAALAALLLLTNRLYLFMGTAQYADILLGFYLLGTVVCALWVLKENDVQGLALLGGYLGLLSFAKNEGLVMSILFFIFISFDLLKNPRWRKDFSSIWRRFALALAATGSATFIFKIFLAPINRDISWDTLKLLPLLFDHQRLATITDYFGKTLFDTNWQSIWLLVTAMFLLGFKKYFTKEMRVVSLFFILYLLFVLMIYVTTTHFDLVWRLNRTAGRILFYLLPSALFVSFYAHWRGEGRSGHSEKPSHKGIRTN